MENEKLRILKMLENGQITADEASRLLQAASSPGTPPPRPHTPPPVHHSAPNNNGRPPGHGAAHGHGGHTPHPSTTPTLDDLGRKFENFARDMSPKVKKFAESAVSAIAGATDKISDAFTTPPSHGSAPSRPVQPHRPTAPSRPATPSPAGTHSTNVELLVDPSAHNELSLSSLNGSIRIKGYNGDKITATITYRAHRPGAPIALVQLGNKYYLNYESEDFAQVSIDAYVPERAFGVVKLDGMNGTVDCATMTTTHMWVNNANGSVNLSGISAEDIKVETSNGSLDLNHITATTGMFENMNGPVKATELDIANLKLTNYNSPVSVIMSGFHRHVDYLWNVETGNGKLSMNLPTLPDLGYHIKAHAAMGDIRLGLTGLQFLINEPSLVEARSTSFDHGHKRVKLAAETSNASLTIS